MKKNQVLLASDACRIVPGCTLSKKFYDEDGYLFMHYSLAKKTSISAESYERHKAVIMLQGEMDLFTKEDLYRLHQGQLLITPINQPVGVKSEYGAIYAELTLKKSSNIHLPISKVLSVNEQNKIITDDPQLKISMIHLDHQRRSIDQPSLLYVTKGSGTIDGRIIKASEHYFSDHYRLMVKDELDGVLIEKINRKNIWQVSKISV